LSGVAIDAAIAEFGTATLTGNISDPDTNTFVLAINWGDSPVVQLVSLPLGATNFQVTHQYLDTHLAGVASQAYWINLTLTDNDGVNNADFLSAIYQDLLGRQVDASALSYYLNYLSTGGTDSGVAQAIDTSTEYQQRLVNTYYEQFLHRAADSAGLSYGVNFLGSGGTDEQYISTLVGSTEYFINRGQNSNSGFLQALFYDLLHRAVDPTSQSFYLGRMSGGTPASTIATEVLGSAEYRTDLVRAWIQRFLHREPSPGDTSYFVGQLNAVATDEQVIASIAGSLEYYNVRSGGTAAALTSLVVTNPVPALSKVSITTPILAGTNATVSGEIIDPGSGPFTLAIDWGDGSAAQPFDLGSSNSFNFSHFYSIPNAAYSVTLSLNEADDPGTNTLTIPLHVLAPAATITSFSILKGIPHLTGQGFPNVTYTIEASSNLTSWSYLGGALADGNGVFAFDDRRGATQRAQFYRYLSP
jgi:hypothetical protein